MLATISSTFVLDIVSAEGNMYSGDAKMVVVPSQSGELGIMPRHAPLLAMLKPGEVTITTRAGEVEFLYVSGGYIEVQPHCVTILADTALRGEEIDEQAARESMKRAEAVVHTARLYIDRDRAQLEVMKALAQLKVLEHARRDKRNRL